MRVGDYELEEELGRGGMGVVHRARHVELGRHVALKRLVRLGGQRSQRFEAEAQALARLKHPNIVTIHEVGRDADGKPFIAMALIEGRSLAEVLRGGPLPARRAAEIARDLAWALDHAHRAGVLHRDIKPANILIAHADSVPVLTDFGLAQELSDERERLTRTGQLIGTPVYMAPEQAASERSLIGPETDVYGLGATLYAMLTGEPPIVAGTLMALITAVVERPPTPPGIDPALDAITLTCLAKAPRERYPDASELALDLDRYLAGTPISASAVRPRRLTPSRTGALLLLLAAVGLGGIGLALGGVFAPPPHTPPTSSPTTSSTPAAPDPQAEERLGKFADEIDPSRWRPAARAWLRDFPEHPRAAPLRAEYLRRGLAAPLTLRVTGASRPYTVHFVDPWRLVGLRDLDSRFDVWSLRTGQHRGSYGALSNETASWSVYATSAQVLFQRMGRRSLVRWDLKGRRPRGLGPQRYTTTLESEWAASADGRRLAVLRVLGPRGGGQQVNRVDVLDVDRPRAPALLLDKRPGWVRDLGFVGDLLVAWGEGEVVTYDLRKPRPRPTKLPRAVWFLGGDPRTGVGVVRDAGGRLALVRLATGHRISELPDAPRSTGRLGGTAAFSVDGSRMFVRVASAESTWEVWEIDPPKRVARVPCGLAKGEPQGVASLVLSPDGARLCGVSWADGYNLIVRWEIAAPRQ